MEQKLSILIALVDDYPAYNLIEAGLYLGSVDAFKNKSFIKKIGAVVSITRIPTEEFGLPEHINYKEGTHLDICLADHEDANISQHFKEAFDFIYTHINDGRAVFVHCAAGISRSATLVVSFLMRRHRMSVYDALKYVKKQRPCVRPNDGFLQQLIEYEEELK